MATNQARTTSKRVVRYRAQVRASGGFVSETFAKRADAVSWANKLEGSLEAGIASPPRAARTHTVTELIDVYLKSPAAPVKSIATARIRLAWWEDRIGSMTLAALTKARVREELQAKADEGCTNTTVNRKLAAIRRVLNYGIRNLEWLAVNGATDIENRPARSGRKRVAQPGDFPRLLAAARTLAANAPAGTAAALLPEFLIVAHQTGMRRGELQSLKWSYVLDDRIELPDSKNGSPRSVPLNEVARVALDAVGRTQSEFVFATTRGRPIEPNAPQKAARELAGLGAEHRGEHLAIHTLRHSAITQMAATGANAFQIMAASGHKTMQTAARYVHGQHEMAVSAMAGRVVV